MEIQSGRERELSQVTGLKLPQAELVTAPHPHLMMTTASPPFSGLVPRAQACSVCTAAKSKIYNTLVSFVMGLLNSLIAPEMAYGLCQICP